MFTGSPYRYTNLDLANFRRMLTRAFDDTYRLTAEVTCLMRIASLTKREREVMDLVVAGHLNKEIAARLGINQRTVETHRATVMRKMAAASLSELVRQEILAREGHSSDLEKKKDH